MKILHVVHNSPPLLCGYSIRTGYIVNLQRESGLEPWVVSSGQHPNGQLMREAIGGIEYWRTEPAPASSVPFLREYTLMASLERRVEAAVREVRPDIIHAHSPVLVGLPALRVARRVGVPLLYEIRDLWENASVDRGRFSAGSPLYRVARTLETHVLARADAVVTICDLLKRELEPRVGGVGRTHVIANGVDAEGFTPQLGSQTLRQRWSLQDKEVILYAGTFQRYEGLDLLIRAIGRVVRHRPAAHLVIVGGSAGFAGRSQSASAEEIELLSLVTENNLTPHVTFTGRIPHAEVKAMYALADVVAYPRRWTLTTSLTTPLKPLEAMAMSKAVIVSDVPPMKELVSDGTTGLLFRAGDVEDLARACTQLLSDPALSERLGFGAREWVVRDRQWKTLVSKYRSLYESLLDRPADMPHPVRAATPRVSASIGR